MYVQYVLLYLHHVCMHVCMYEYVFHTFTGFYTVKQYRIYVMQYEYLCYAILVQSI